MFCELPLSHLPIMMDLIISWNLLALRSLNHFFQTSSSVSIVFATVRGTITLIKFASLVCVSLISLQHCCIDRWLSFSFNFQVPDRCPPTKLNVNCNLFGLYNHYEPWKKVVTPYILGAVYCISIMAQIWWYWRQISNYQQLILYSCFHFFPLSKSCLNMMSEKWPGCIITIRKEVGIRYRDWLIDCK